MTTVSAPRGALATRLLRLAGPVAVSRLGIMGFGVADTVMVGQLAPKELSHQALGWAPTAVLLVAAIGLLTGVQVLAARAIGEGRPQEAGAIWRRGLMVSLVAGIVAIAVVAVAIEGLLTGFGVAPAMAGPAADVSMILALSIPMHLAFVASSYFLEAVQRPTPPAVAMWTANLLNIGVNWALIPQLGAEGSAWATVASRGFLAASLIGFILWSPRLGAYAPRARAGAGGYRALLNVGAASAASQAVEAGAFSGMTVVAARIGESAVAAYTILLNLLAVVFMVALGLASATAVLAAEAEGRGARGEAARASWMGLALNTAFMAAIGAGLWALAHPAARAFTSDPALIALVAGLIPLAVAVLAPDGGQVVAASALRARGDNWFPTFSHVLAYAIVMPALGLWLAEARGWGVAGLMWAIVWASVLSVGVLMARLAALDRRAPQGPAS